MGQGSRSLDLARLIVERASLAGLTEDARLPTERQLVGELGVSRTAVRDALALLEAEGRISREVGRGTFLVPEQPPARDRMLEVLDESRFPDDVGPADVMAARRLIEPRLLSLVVSWATERDFQEMDRCLAGGDAAETADEFEAWDLALHRSFVLASHSQLVVRMYGAIEAARRGTIWGTLKRRNDSPKRREGRQSEHRSLVAALRSREVTAAIGAMEIHLDSVQADLLGHVTTTAELTSPEAPAEPDR